MRAVNFAHHHIQEVGELIASAYSLKKRLIMSANGSPVATVEVGIIIPAVDPRPVLRKGSFQFEASIYLPVGNKLNL